MDEIHAAVSMAAQANNKNYGNLLFGTSFVGIIQCGCVGHLGYFGQPHILARFMAANSVKSLNNARRIGMTWWFYVHNGRGGGRLFWACLYDSASWTNCHLKDNNERIFIGLAQLLFNPWIVGVVLSANNKILAAVMSTSQLSIILVCKFAITEDFIKGLFAPTATQKSWFGLVDWIGAFGFSDCHCHQAQNRVYNKVC